MGCHRSSPRLRSATGKKGEKGADGAVATNAPTAAPTFRYDLKGKNKWCNNHKSYASPGGTSNNANVYECVVACHNSGNCGWVGWRSDRYCEFWTSGSCGGDGSTAHDQPNHDIYRVY